MAYSSFITEAYLAANFTPLPGITPGSDNTLFMSCDQILARYLVRVKGVTTTGNRLPGKDEVYPAYDFYICSEYDIWGYEVASGNFYSVQGSQVSFFTDIARGNNWCMAIRSDGRSFKIEEGTSTDMGLIGGTGSWISIEYWSMYNCFIAVSSDGNVAYIEESPSGSWAIAADLSSAANNYKVVVNGTDCYIGTTWSISKCSFGNFSTWTTLTSFSQDYYLRGRSFTVNDNSSYILKAYGKYDNSNDYAIEGADIPSSGSVSRFFATTPNKLSYSNFAEYLAGNGVVARAVFSQESGSSPVFYIDSNGWYTEAVLNDAAENGSNIVGVGNGCIYLSTNGGSTLENPIVSGGAYNYVAICPA